MSESSLLSSHTSEGAHDGAIFILNASKFVGPDLEWPGYLQRVKLKPSALLKVALRLKFAELLPTEEHTYQASGDASGRAPLGSAEPVPDHEGAVEGCRIDSDVTGNDDR